MTPFVVLLGHASLYFASSHLSHISPPASLHAQEWLDWDDVQRTRLTCLERLEAATTPKQIHALLQDALMISLFSVTPPDVSTQRTLVQVSAIIS